MRYYFSLQFKMLNRHLTDFGLLPVAGYLISLLTFIGISVFLFSKTEYAEYIYIVVALSLLLKFSETDRNRFLKSSFNVNDYYKMRITENVLLALPFAAFLLAKTFFLPAALLMITCVFLVIVNFKSTLNFTIPTPFSKKPFEFIAGFRNTFYIIIFALFLIFMAITADNFNLGIFALILILLIFMTYYANLENEYYVWIYSLSPNEFLFHKIKIAIMNSTILCLPVIASLGIFFPGNIGVIAGFQCLGYLYLITVILAKYSDFPNKMNLPQVLVIAFSISFPPLLLGVIPFFYFKSITRLKEILE